MNLLAILMYSVLNEFTSQTSDLPSLVPSYMNTKSEFESKAFWYLDWVWYDYDCDADWIRPAFSAAKLE